MDVDHDNGRLVINEDRLSSLPDELIHRILSFMDTKFAVQTCLLSSRWKFFWTSMPSLSFSSRHFSTLPKFAKFVTHFLSHRNHQIDVYSVKLYFHGAASQVFVTEIANYAFSHNVQELTVISWPKNKHKFPPCLFSSRSLKQFTFSSPFFAPCLTPTTPWEFPALTTLHLSEITLCDDTLESVDLFSKCVNLENLSLKGFIVEAKVLDIITPRLTSLMLIDGRRSNVINVIAPQLENLTIIDCSINYLNAPPSLSSLFFCGYKPPRWFKDRFHSLNKVTVSLSLHGSNMKYNMEDARETINMLQDFQSARFLTLNTDVVECISSFPNLLSHNSLPFSNLICLNLVFSKVEMSSEARNFLLRNSPSGTFIMELLEEAPTTAMRARLVADIESHLTELQASLEQESIFVERNRLKEKIKVALENLETELRECIKNRKMQSEPRSAHSNEILAGIVAQIQARVTEVLDLVSQHLDDAIAMLKRELRVLLILNDLPMQQMTEIEACYSHQFQETNTLIVRLDSEISSLRKIIHTVQLNLLSIISAIEDD